MKIAKLIAALCALGFIAVGGVAIYLISMASALPQILKVNDYHPRLVTEVYARGGEKIGEFFNENRTIVPYEKMPKRLVQSFISAEDSTFFEHSGVNFIAIGRAFIVNLLSGEKRQGASTITQQVARSILLLTNEKTYTRKIKEILLAQKMEQHLSKEDILYLYLNQIYFGEGAYGVSSAAETYFRKTVDKLTVAEMAILAGLPQAPTDYAPSDHPQKAKNRQKYVLGRMRDLKFISPAEYNQALNEPILVYTRKEYKQVAPYFVEALRQLMVKELGEKAVLDEGLRIYTSLDFKAQQAAVISLQEGLREVDKRQGYRGPLRSITAIEDQQKFLLASRKFLTAEKAPTRIIKPDGNVVPEKPLETFHKRDGSGHIVTNIPDYVNKNQVVEGLVIKVDDSLGLTTVRFAEGIGLIDIADMGWARKPDSNIKAMNAPKLQKPSTAIKPGDVVMVKVAGDKFFSERLVKPFDPKKNKKKPAPPPLTGLPNFEEFAQLRLEQRPIAEAALLSFDQKTSDVIAMVGGYEWVHKKNEFNRTIQAKRQTGSAFKTIVYASALDKGYSPATPIQDAPIVYETEAQEGQDDIKTWKPHNHGQKFEGDILFRRALIRSLNIPTVKILEKIGIPWVMEYAKRLGVFSPLNADLSLGLGSSSLTLYEMTKVFSQLGRLGQRIRPIVIRKVLDKDGKEILTDVSLDKRFEKDLNEIDHQFEEKRKTALAAIAANPAPTPGQVPPGSPEVPPKPQLPQLFFQDPNQLIRPQTAYVMTTLLSGVINETGGTAGKARALGRPAAGKTGSTNGYFDGWFIGYTPQIASGVWVGFDAERSLGMGEVGGDTALPIWVEYMKAAHQDLPILDFSIPNGVVFANIDNQTGNLASGSSSQVIRQAFIEGTEPTQLSGSPSTEDESDFLKKDLTD
jgi:penicillin-binding protein 1A